MKNGSGSHWKERLEDWWIDSGLVRTTLGVALIVYLLVATVLGVIWSMEPDLFSVQEKAAERAEALNTQVKTGFTSTVTAIEITDTLLNKPGGYLGNDMTPPGVWLDNIPNWEFGALVQVRDFTRAMRKDFSRSQSQSTEDPDLAIAEPQFNFDSQSWAMPSTESEYRKGLKSLDSYLVRLADPERE